MAKDDPKRDARLAEALRQNLRLRKAQAREVDTGEVFLPGDSEKAGGREG
jgi:hypothetical protein